MLQIVQNTVLYLAISQAYNNDTNAKDTYCSYEWYTDYEDSVMQRQCEQTQETSIVSEAEAEAGTGAEADEGAGAAASATRHRRAISPES